MSRRIPRIGTLVFVEWLDHWDYSNGWTDIKKLRNPKPAEVKTVGWLTGVGEQAISLGATMPGKGGDDGKKGLKTGGNACCIVTCAITNIVKLEEPGV